MLSPMNALFQDAEQNFDDLLRALDREELREYRECEGLAARHWARLSALDGDAAEKYAEARDLLEWLLRQAYFRRGVAAGVALAASAGRG